MASQDTLFTNSAGAVNSTLQYVLDVFSDITEPANTNSALTVSSNPLGDSFGNDDTTKLGVKTLYIQSLTLEPDHSKWVNGEPTYRVNWNENFPSVHAYVWGNFTTNTTGNTPTLTFKTIGDGIGVNGVIRRLAFIVNGNTAATATAQVAIDGVNTTTISFANTALEPSANVYNKNNFYTCEATNETYAIHDIRLTALQASTLTVVGVVAYFENAGLNIDQFPGNSYVNKSLVSTTLGATFAIPTYGSSLGGKALVYKTSTGYVLDAVSSTTMTSFANGSSGTNLMNLSVGTGASFPAGSGVVAWNGSSMYVGSVTSVSTDTLTMGQTLAFGISNPIYRSWVSGQSIAINSSMMTLSSTLDFTKMNGFTNPIFGQYGQYAFYGNNLGLTLIDSVQSVYFLGASGYMQVDGDFVAADIELIGNAIYGATHYVNGLPGWGISAGQTGSIKKTVFSEAGGGWNNFQIVPSASMGLIGIAKINLYQRARDLGISYGMLSEIETLQTYTDRGSLSASFMALGTAKRVYADQLAFQGLSAWIWATNSKAPGLAQYTGSTSNASLSFQYFGKNFGFIGTAATGATLKLDGVGFNNTFNVVQSVATEGFHTITYQLNNGNTAVIQAIDYGASRKEVKFIPQTSQMYLGTLGATLPAAQTVTQNLLAPRTVGTTAPSGGVARSNSSGGSFTTTSTSFVDVTNLTVTITSTGRPIMVFVQSDGSSNDSNLELSGGDGTASGSYQILNGSTQLGNYSFHSLGTGVTMDVPSSCLATLDFRPAGTYTYKVQAKVSGTGSPSTQVNYCVLVAYEI